MRRADKLVVVAALALLVLNASGQRPAWKEFTSRAGWSINYPADWQIASCHSCKDPTAPEVFVDFSPPGPDTLEGWVMVSPLETKPSDTSVDSWLAKVCRTNNLNPPISHERMAVNGLPALKVRYRSYEGEMEDVYVISGSKTFSMSFSADPSSPGTPIDKLRNYATYLKMVESFHVKS